MSKIIAYGVQNTTKVSVVVIEKDTFEPQHEISSNVVSATNRASDQAEHTRSLIRAFDSRLI